MCLAIYQWSYSPPQNLYTNYPSNIVVYNNSAANGLSSHPTPLHNNRSYWGNYYQVGQVSNGSVNDYDHCHLNSLNNLTNNQQTNIDSGPTNYTHMDYNPTDSLCHAKEQHIQVVDSATVVSETHVNLDTVHRIDTLPINNYANIFKWRWEWI